jgi:AraC-like DNA-binding protein
MQPLTLDWLTTLVLLGAVQGFVLAVALATHRRNRTANRLLAVAVFAFSLQMLSVVYHAVGFERVFPHFFGVAYPLPLLFGPLVFLYALTASDRGRGLRRRDALHVVPFVAVVLWGLPVYTMSGAGKLALYEQLRAGLRPESFAVIDTLKYVSGIAYSIATITALRHHRRRIEDSYSSLEHVNLRWLLVLTLGGGAIWGLATTLHVLSLLGPPGPAVSEDSVVALGIAILVYGIGYMALRQPEVFTVPTGEWRVQRPAAESAPPAGTSPRYERSGLGEREAAALEARLLDLMEHDHPYRTSELTLADLAERLETSPHKLSEVLNAQLGQTFYDFVNGYRVREVQRRLADDTTRNLTLLSLALDAGFASKSTFNAAFKKHTGRTPSEYRRR